MKYTMDYNFECNTFSAQKVEDVAMVYFKDKLLMNITDLSIRDKILSYLDLVSKSSAIKIVILFGAPETKGCEEYFDFYRRVLNSKEGVLAIQRMHNIMNQLILKIVELDKIIIHVNHGRIISSFLNISLACDYRILGEDSVFQNPCLDLGLLPKGGGAFFLPKIIGHGKCLSILTSARNIPAAEALALGIVHEVVPDDDLNDAAMKAAAKFKRMPASSLTGIKRLLNYSLKDLKDYLEFENQESMRIITTTREWMREE